MRASLKNRIARTTLVLSLALIAVATLTPTSNMVITGRWCLLCGEFGASDFIANLILFVPVGASWRVLGHSGARVLLYGFLISLAVESIQTLLPGRDAGLGDLLSNTGGTGLGWLVAYGASWWAFPTPRRAAALRTLSLSLGVAAIFATGILLFPSRTDTPRYYGEFAQTLDHGAWSGASAARVTLGDFEFPRWNLESTDLVKALLDAGAPLAIVGTAGHESADPETFFTIYDHEQRVAIRWVGADGDDLVLKYRPRAASLLLDYPDVRLEGALREVVAGEALTVAVADDHGAWCISANSISHCGLGYTVGSGWGLVRYPTSLPNPVRMFFNHLWLAGLFVPFGFMVRRKTDFFVGGVVAALALWIVPAVTVLVATPFTEWIAVGVGIVGGRGISRLLERFSLADALALYQQMT